MAPPEAVYISALIALFVSFLFGITSHIQNLGLDHLDARAGTIVIIGTTALAMWLLTPFYFSPDMLATRAAAYFALAGLVVPAISLSLATQSVRIMGPSLTQGLASTSPMFAMFLAVILVGEQLTAGVFIGTMVVVGGVMLVVLRGKGPARSWPLWAISLPFGAAVARAISHPVTKLGLLELPSPMTAALFASTVSIIVLYAVYRLGGRRMPPLNRGYLWFALCGLINAVGLTLLNVALEIGNVVVVSPIIAAAPVFTMLTGYLYFKREVITARMVAAIALIFAGCILIVFR
ncbi:MAG: hypothetical protein RLZ98_1542 [Pseudomonadota bacterium]|jgi:drug/metabolite transporter (DMT)-like permease